MGFSDFCNAIYKRKPPVTSKAKFVRAVFQSAGSAEAIDDSYAAKLFRGDKPLSVPQYDSFPNPIDQASLVEFLSTHLQPQPGARVTIDDRCKEVARKAGLPTSLEIDPDLFIKTLTDWFNAIIHDPDNCDVLEKSYQLRQIGAEPETSTLRPEPLYAGDRVDVMKPPSLQDYEIGFYTEFTHTWVLKNIGLTAWSGRKLVCINPTNNALRPVHPGPITVPDCSPSATEFIRLECAFKARGCETKAESTWEMQDEEGNNCFPNESTQLNVVATIINPNAKPTGAGQ